MHVKKIGLNTPSYPLLAVRSFWGKVWHHNALFDITLVLPMRILLIFCPRFNGPTFHNALEDYT